MYNYSRYLKVVAVISICLSILCSHLQINSHLNLIFLISCSQQNCVTACSFRTVITLNASTLSPVCFRVSSTSGLSYLLRHTLLNLYLYCLSPGFIPKCRPWHSFFKNLNFSWFDIITDQLYTLHINRYPSF